MSRQANQIPYRAAREEDKPYTDRAYKRCRGTVLVLRIIAAVSLAMAIVFAIVFYNTASLIGMLGGGGIWLLVAACCLVCTKFFSHYPTEVFVAQVVDKSWTRLDNQDTYFVTCKIPSSTAPDASYFEKSFQIQYTDYQKAQPGSWVYIIKINWLRTEVYLIE